MKLKINKGYAVAENRTDVREYGTDHYELLKSYEDKAICREITDGRIKLVSKYCRYSNILDVGCGTGYFIKKYSAKTRYFAFGYDVLKKTVKWLKQESRYIDPYEYLPEFIDGITLWDVFEHLPEPTELLKTIRRKKYLFLSIPIFGEITEEAIKASKHYRPKEHLFYFSYPGLVEYMKDAGFDLIEMQDFEIKAGRESIYSFVFQKY